MQSKTQFFFDKKTLGLYSLTTIQGQTRQYQSQTQLVNENYFPKQHDQMFCMQTDSHMDFSDNFDTDLIKMFHLAENDYAVLSTYVTDIEHNNEDPTNVPNLCMVTFTSSIRNWGTKECNMLQKPKLTNGMWFA